AASEAARERALRAAEATRPHVVAASEAARRTAEALRSADGSRSAGTVASGKAAVTPPVVVTV
ncbi:MAG: hypothetical protein M3N11_05255, partial [Actinomycetota bacterium]|nr:hypothetical protein [Actinomycetota bacterium]